MSKPYSKKLRIYLLTGLLLLIFSYSVNSAISHLTVTTKDGLELRFEPNGELVGVRADGKDLPSGDLQGGFFVYLLKSEARHLNMVTNANLEDDIDKDGIPDDFISAKFCSRDIIAHTGKYSVKCEVSGTQDQISDDFGVYIPVKGGNTYRISFWLKAHERGGQNPVSVGYVRQFDNENKFLFQRLMDGGAGWNADWTRVSLLLTTDKKTSKIFVYTNIYNGFGTIWVDDFRVEEVGMSESWRYIPTKALLDRKSIVITGEDTEIGLKIQGRWETKDKQLILSGEIVNINGRDRSFRLAYRLPVNAVGGIWWKDIQSTEPIKKEDFYSHAAKWGEVGPFSVYPFSAIDLDKPRVGLSLAVPMDPPRPFRLIYSPVEGYSVEWDFSLSPKIKQYPSKANFFALIYRHDPLWGFRSASKIYYELFPDWFKVRVPTQGNWYVGAEVIKLPHIEDFGLAFREISLGHMPGSDRDRGMLDFSYTEPWGWWGWAVGNPQGTPALPYKKALEFIETKAFDEQLASGSNKYNHAIVAKSILNSGVWNVQGEYQWGGWDGGYNPSHGGYNWAVNPSPYIGGRDKIRRFGLTYAWEIEPYLALGVSGIYLDSIANVFTAIPNYRQEHMENSRHPLTFNSSNGKSVQLGIWNHYEFIEYLSKDLHNRGKLLMANIFPPNWVFFNHLLDIMGHEIGSADSPELMRMERTLAYQKPYCWLLFKTGLSECERDQIMQKAMFFGIFPNIAGGSGEAEIYERFRPLFKKYMPIIKSLAETGWEPITYAISEPSIWIERFGPKAGRLFLTAWNPSDKNLLIRFSVDWDALGFAPAKQCIRLPDGKEIEMRKGEWQDLLLSQEVVVYSLQ